MFVWTVAIMGPFSVVDVLIGEGWMYTLPVAVAAAAGVWHSNRKIRQFHATKLAYPSDYVAVS